MKARRKFGDKYFTLLSEAMNKASARVSKEYFKTKKGYRAIRVIKREGAGTYLIYGRKTK